MSSPLGRTRPRLPAGYGLPENDDDLLEWSAVEARLIAAKHYWLATVQPSGRPHLIPHWSVWVDDAFYYDGSPDTKHARNAEANPACSLSLEDAQHAVILEGTSISTWADPEILGARLADAFGKYHDDGYAPAADAWADQQGGGLRVFSPAAAMAWFRFPADATRFVF